MHVNWQLKINTELRHLMKNLIYILLLTMISAAVFAKTADINSNDGYPYNVLINKSDSVSLIYNEQENNIHCKTKVHYENINFISSEVIVKKETFNRNPLKHCLPRQQAKNILSQLYKL